MNILLTGGAGYIGSFLTSSLLSNGHQLISIDNLLYGKTGILPYLKNKNFKFIEIDIRNRKKLESVFKSHNIDVIVHLAAISSAPGCKNNPELARSTNMEGSINLIECAEKHPVDKFIFSSTCSNYGKPESKNTIFNETSPLTPLSLYAETKIDFENFLTDFKGDIKRRILRFATAYGLSPRMRFDLTVNDFTMQLFIGKELELFGENTWRPYCHIGDIARAIGHVINDDCDKSEISICNVGNSNENYTKKMIVDMIIKNLGNGKFVISSDNSDNRDYRVDFSKFAEKYDFSTQYTVKSGIEEIIQALKENRFKNPEDRSYTNFIQI